MKNNGLGKNSCGFVVEVRNSMKKIVFLIMTMLAVLCILSFFAGKDKREEAAAAGVTEQGKEVSETMDVFTRQTTVGEVVNAAAFKGRGKLLFPLNRPIDNDVALEDVEEHLLWYEGITPERTVSIINFLHTQALAGKQVFYDIYTEEEKEAEPDKQNTGLVFFRGQPGGKTAILNAGGGFVYVGAIHDSFPHAMELARQGYNAFALIYRPDARLACEDLARTIAFIHEHAEELQVDVKDYSLWGGSAGARMAAGLGSFGTEYFGEKPYPRPAAVIMQYTGLSEVYGNEPPTYNCVGTGDYIASYRVMERRIERIKAQGTEAEIDVYPGLPHGFGLGEGTVAEGWFNHAVSFWQRQMKN